MSTRITSYNVCYTKLLRFGYTARRVFGYLKLGKPENRFDHFDKRISNVLAIAFGQTKILRDPIAGPIHFGIFWGFVILV